MDHAADILNTAETTMRERAAERDVAEERVMGRIVEMYNSLTGSTMTELQGWQFMIILKMVRGQSGNYRKDDYVDQAAYAALAGECASKDKPMTRFNLPLSEFQ